MLLCLTATTGFNNHIIAAVHLTFVWMMELACLEFNVFDRQLIMIIFILERQYTFMITVVRLESQILVLLSVLWWNINCAKIASGIWTLLTLSSSITSFFSISWFSDAITCTCIHFTKTLSESLPFQDVIFLYCTWISHCWNHPIIRCKSHLS